MAVGWRNPGARRVTWTVNHAGNGGPIEELFRVKRSQMANRLVLAKEPFLLAAGDGAGSRSKGVDPINVTLLLFVRLTKAAKRANELVAVGPLMGVGIRHRTACNCHQMSRQEKLSSDDHKRAVDKLALCVGCFAYGQQRANL